jgi:hypothetical protein
MLVLQYNQGVRPRIASRKAVRLGLLFIRDDCII